MSDNVHGCATDAVSIRRNVFFSYFHIDRINISKDQKIKFSRQAFVLHLISL